MSISEERAPQFKITASRQFNGLGFGLASHLYENGSALWPHITTLKFSPPIGYEGNRRQTNPFVTAPVLASKPSSLTSTDVCKIYEAMAFGMWAHGVVMNAHVVIIWSMIGLDELQGAKVLGEYLHEAKKWMRVGSGPRIRRISKPRSGSELHYVWVHENAPGRGFHSHVLMNVDQRIRKEFDAWSRNCLSRLTGRNVPWRAFRIVPSYAKNDEAAVVRAWSWFKYITKQLGENELLVQRSVHSGICEVAARSVFRPWRARPTLPVPPMKMTGASHSIGARQQAEFQFRSSFRKGETLPYQGDELWWWQMQQKCRGLQV